MARRIEHRARSEWAADRVHATLVDEEYLRRRLTVLGGADAALMRHERANGVVTYRLRHGISVTDLPDIARKFLQGDLVIERTETWSAERSGRYAGRVRATTPGLPGQLEGTMLLVDDQTDGGSLLTVEGQVRVSVPLVGGKIEESIAKQVDRLLAKEAAFTREWLDDRHD